MKNDGGPAFPGQAESGKFGEFHSGHGAPVKFPIYENRPGMTLRDYFAGQALAGFLANSIRHATWNINDAHAYAEATAAQAYLQADAMLAERDK
jgi:hypothetical protein